MSTTIDEVPGMDEAPGRGTARRGGGYERPDATMQKKGKFELYSWVFMRVSGLLLIFMTLYHLYWWNLVVGVEHLSSEVVLERWNNPLWRLFNVALASFAMLHGLNGLRYSIEDYIRNPGARKVVKAIAYTVVLAILLWGIWGLLTFDFASAARR